MSWLMGAIYDPFMRQVEDECLRAWRRELLAEARGEVLEIGAGTGANLPHYLFGASHISRLVLTEPDRHMRARLDRALGERKHEVVSASAEELPFDAGRFDFVVCTLVLCSVRDLQRSVGEIARVLAPGGKLLFLEHTADDERPDRLAWQRRVEPFWRVIAGNCHLTRRPTLAFERAGLVVDSVARERIRKAMPLVRAGVRGVARRP